jgi:hypothetical protein
MKQLSNLPDLGGMLKQIDLRLRLESISDQSILGYAILMALREGKPLGNILTTILDAYEDNPNSVLCIIGDDTMKIIQELDAKNKSHA